MPHPYCTQTGDTDGDIMPSRISLAQLMQLTSETDDPDDIDQDVIDSAIEGADALIDGYLAPKYSVPLATVPALVKEFSAKLAAFNLFEKRAASVGMPEPIRDSRDDVVNFLKDFAKGTASLGIDPPPAANTLTNAKVKSNPRVFTKDSMRGL